MFALVKKTFLYLLLVYAFLGFVVIPLILKPKLIDIVSQESYAKVTIGSVYFNPFLFKLKLSDVVLSSSRDEELVRFKEFLVDIELYGLVSKTLHVKEISLLEPQLSLVHNTDKTFNILNILKPSKEDNNSSLELPRVIVERVSIEDGDIFYDDFTLKTPFSFSFNTIGFELRDIDSDESEPSKATLRLYTTLGDGGFVDFRSEIESIISPKVKGSLDFEASKLYTEWKYVQDILNLEVADGKISFHGDYIFSLDDLNATKIENLALNLEKLRIKPKAKHGDILNIEKLSVIDATLLPMQKSVEIERVSLSGLNVLAKRNEKGEVDWLEYIKVVDESNSTKLAKEDAKSSSHVKEPWTLLLKELSLEKIVAGFEDRSISPSVNTKIDELNIYAEDITLLGEKAFTYNLDMQLNSTSKCNSKGSVRHKNLTVETFLECRAIDIVHYNPYIEKEAKKALKLYNLDLKSASLNFKTDIELQNREENLSLKVKDAKIALGNFKVNKKRHKRELASFSNFVVSGVDVDTEKKTLMIEKVLLNKLSVDIQKYKNGSFNVDKLIEVKKSKKTEKKKRDNPYLVKLKHFALNGSDIDFKDYSIKSRTKNRISAIYANVYDIDLKKYSWLTYNLAMRINTKGRVRSNGKLRHSPLKHSGSFDIKNISLTPLTPYIQESAHLSVEDGRVSLKGRSKYQKSSSKPDLHVNGSLLLESLFVDDTLHDTQLLSLSDTEVKSYTLELNPNRLYIDEVDVNSFYVDANIDTNKTLNFSKLMKKRDDTSKESKGDTNSSFSYRVQKINVALGSAKFADYSIPIKFSTHIHDLSGAIYSVSNAPGDTTYINILGEVDEYASTHLKGSVDSANPKAYTDLDFNFKNLDLSALSGYSASFAGHKIDEGKLYLDLGYDITDSNLMGSNSVIIKQIKLGDEIEDENITVLPLGFVIGLLEDSDGVIDIDMPVEGNVDEPDFKYGALVWKTIGSLIADAVTSPFRFLGSLMGIDTASLEYIEFEGALSTISPPQREKLDQVAKMMQKKPKISLKIEGAYDEKIDSHALKLTKLIDLVMIKSGIKNRQEHESAMSNDLLEEIYRDIRDDDGLELLQERLHKEYKGEEFERVYHRELLTLCIDIQALKQAELLSLAERRAQSILQYLRDEKFVQAARVIKAPSTKNKNDSDNIVKVGMQIEVK